MWVSVVLNVALLVAVGRLAHVQRHRHLWSDWTPWVQDTNFGDVMALRYRACGDCANVERQSAGLHHCHKATDCSHLAFLLEETPDRVARLERDLGIAGDDVNHGPVGGAARRGRVER